MIKIFATLTLSLAICQSVLSQNIGINSTGATPAASAMLDITSTDKGLLIPRVALTTTTAATPVTSPTISLLVFNTATAGTAPNNVIPGYYYWNGTAWVAFSTTSAASVAWTLGGNTGITTSHFVGTGDDKALIFKSNNQSYLEFGRRQTLGLVDGYTEYTDPNEKVTYVRSALQFEAPGASFYKPKMWTDANGNFRVKGASAGTDYFEFGSTGSANNGGFEFIIGDDGDEPILFKSYHYINGMSEIMRLQSGRMAVGSNAFDATNPEKLLIDAGVTNSYNLMTGKGSIDNYLQINVKNGSNGGSASSDLVASSNLGTESVNFIDMGINSSGYTSTLLPVLGGPHTAYIYATGNDFVIGNATAAKPLRFFTGGTANTNERMRIDGAGKVGIANILPSEALDVTGNVRFSGALMPNNSAGTSGYLLQSAGAGTAPTWVTPGSVVSTSGWALDGNGVALEKDFGTTSNFSLPFITNNTEKMRLFPTGGLAIGAIALDGTNPEELLVDAGTTTSFNVISGKGSINNYLQLNIQNRSSATAASSDIVASSNLATESTNFVDLGINSSGNTSTGVLGGANTGYLYSTGNDFAIGNATAAKNLSFFTGGTLAGNERMRIDGTGKVGIANVAPSEALDVTGNVRFSGALMPNNSAGTSGYLLQSAGAGTTPTWVTPGSVVSTSGWALDGNGVALEKDFGTTSNFSLPFITNNTEKMRLFPTGGLAIGAIALDGTNPEELLVDAGTTTSFNVISGKGSINNYLQLNIQNRSSATAASSDIVASSNLATESTNFVDLGINSSGNTSTGVLGGANTGYLYSTGNDFAIGNATATKNLSFFTGGTLAGNERMRIDGTGKVGIGKTTPTEVLDINGNVRFSGAIMPNNTAGSAGDILQSTGPGSSPTWLNPNAVLNSVAWVLGGNTGTTAGTNFIGTTDDMDLVFKTDDTEAMRIYSGGQIDLDAGTGTGTDPGSAIYAVGDFNNYLEINVQNLNNGNLASSDIVATADNGDSLSVYVDMGINSGGYSNFGSNILNGANVAYLYAHGRDFKIGNGSPNRNLIFFTNPLGGTLGTNTANGVERMRIEPGGDVGIGTTNPAYKLHVVGDAGKTTGGSDWVIISDKRLKKEIKPFTDGLQVLTKINPIWFQYNGKAGLSNDGKNYVGIVAQEMQAIAPYTIGTFKDEETNTEYLNYDASAVTYILINAVQEQQVMIDSLKKQLEEQNQRLLKLEEKLK